MSSCDLFHVVRAGLPGTRPGLIGMSIDCARGRELDRLGALDFIHVPRPRAKLLGWKLPFGERDETYRERIWQAALKYWNTPMTDQPEKMTDAFLEHAVKTPSQYDPVVRQLAAEVLAHRRKAAELAAAVANEPQFLHTLRRQLPRRGAHSPDATVQAMSYKQGEAILTYVDSQTMFLHAMIQNRDRLRAELESLRLTSLEEKLGESAGDAVSRHLVLAKKFIGQIPSDQDVDTPNRMALGQLWYLCRSLATMLGVPPTPKETSKP